MASAISHGSAVRPNSVAEPSCSNLSPSVAMTDSVRVDPGAMVLTRIPWAPKATAQDRVNDSSAALAAEETTAPPTSPDEANAPEMLTMTPDPRAIIFGSSAAVRKNGALTVTSNVMSNEFDVLLEC